MGYLPMTVLDKFKNCVRKARVLNRRREVKVFKLFELINFIKAEKRKMAKSISNANTTQSDFNRLSLKPRPTIGPSPKAVTPSNFKKNTQTHLSPR